MSLNSDPTHTEWVRSSYSGNGGGNCVEWAPVYLGSGVVPVRDSKDPNTPSLKFRANNWQDFLSALKHGELTD